MTPSESLLVLDMSMVSLVHVHMRGLFVSGDMLRFFAVAAVVPHL